MESTIGRLKYSCNFPNCNNKYYYPKIDKSYVNERFHKFPREKFLRNKWKEICYLDEDTNVDHMYICDIHFDDSQYKNTFTKRLAYDAVPSCIIKHNVH